jgi:hypothetical protein
MMKSLSDWQLGASVAVKPGTQDPDTGDDIGGWQGRISDFGEDEDGTPTVCITWDSLTLKGISKESLTYAIREGLDWQEMYLAESDIVTAQPRDTPSDVEHAADEIENRTEWLHLDEEGERIQSILAGVSSDDMEASLEAWGKYFDRTLQYPFEVEVRERLRAGGRLRIGDRLLITGLSELEDDLYGFLVEGKREREHFVTPLCDLEVTDKKSSNYQPVRDYVVWFANR